MERVPDQTPAGDLIRHALRSLVRPPFRTLWMVGLLMAVVSATLVGQPDDFSLSATLLFALLGLILEMATVVAAAHDAPERSADTWIGNAFRRKATWRFILASIVADFLVAFGLLALIVGGVFLAGIVSLAPQAALLERRTPLEALRRSAELTRAGRGRIRLIYLVLILLPSLPGIALVLVGAEPPSPAAAAAMGAIGTTLSLTAYIALTRAYVELGGGTEPIKPLPPLQPPPDR